MNILIAVDGSEYTKKATAYVASSPEWQRPDLKIHLLHVEPAVASPRARAFLGNDAVNNFYREESLAALAPAETILRDKNIAFQSSYEVGEIADCIQAYVEQNGIDMVVMGSHGHGPLKSVVLGSVATKVLASSSVPVLIVR